MRRYLSRDRDLEVHWMLLPLLLLKDPNAEKFIRKCISQKSDPAECRLIAYSRFKFEYQKSKDLTRFKKIDHSSQKDLDDQKDCDFGSIEEISKIESIPEQINIGKLEEIRMEDIYEEDDFENTEQKTETKQNQSIINLPHHSDYRDDKAVNLMNIAKQQKCQLPNATYNNGRCRCIGKTPFGDPYQTGCWGCSRKCYPGATCVSQDRCQCPLFYVGDGLKNCTVHVPIIRSVRGRIQDSVVVVDIEDVPFPTPATAFCRIGFDYTMGRLVASNRIECSSLAMIHRHPTVAVSWDKQTWSMEDLRLFFDAEPWVATTNHYYAFLIAFFILFCFGFRYYRKIYQAYVNDADPFELAFQI